MGEDWQALTGRVLCMDVAAVEEFIERALTSATSNYRIVQRSLEEFCFSQVRRNSDFTFHDECATTTADRDTAPVSAAAAK